MIIILWHEIEFWSGIWTDLVTQLAGNALVMSFWKCLLGRLKQMCIDWQVIDKISVNWLHSTEAQEIKKNLLNSGKNSLPANKKFPTPGSKISSPLHFNPHSTNLFIHYHPTRPSQLPFTHSVELCQALVSCNIW